MSVELRKKSSSFSQSTNPLKTVNKYNVKESNLATCRSVSAFADTVHQNVKNQTNIGKQIEKFSIENGRHCSAKKPVEQSKSNNKGHSFVGYKQAIEKRKRKVVTGKKNFYDELFLTIDAFQETLSSLPLDKLILSENPFYWVEEQIKTFQKLQDKFIRITHTLKEETKLYYQSKLECVVMVIKNIKQNLDSLNDMNLLKNYNSGGTSIQSRNSQSTSSLGQTSNFPFNLKSDQPHQRSRYQTQAEDKINQGRNYVTEVQSSEGMSLKNEENKENVMRHSNQPLRKSYAKNQPNPDKRTFQKVQITQRDKFELKEYKSSNSQSSDIVDNIRTLRSQRSFSEEDENSLRENGKQKMNQFISKETENTNYNDENGLFFKRKNMNKTVSKYQRNPKEDVKYQRQSLMNFIANQSKETFNTIENEQFQESVDYCEETKRTNALGINSNSIVVIEQLNALRKQLETKNQLIVNMDSKHDKFIKAIRQEFDKKEKHYLETIYELKQENREKQNAIKQLLMESQEIRDQLELTKNKLKQSTQINKKMTEKLTLFQQSAQTLSNELRKYKLREDELRETVQLQRQRTKKLQKEIQEIQTQMKQTNDQIKLISEEKKSIFAENQKTNKQLSVLNEDKVKMKQKEEIYKLKYFRLYADFDKFKEKVNDDSEYWKKICLSCKKEYTNPHSTDPQKHTELRQLISFHKKRLLSQ